MAWALKFDGVNDYCTLATATHLHQSSITWRLEFRLKISSYGTNNQYFLFARTTDGYGTIRIKDGEVRVRYRSVNVVITGTGLTADGLFHDIEIRRESGGAHYLVVDGTPVGDNPVFSSTNTNSPVNTIGAITVTTGNYCESELEYIKFFNTSGGATPTLFWDAEASSHAAGTVVLSETVGSSKDATGVNMPTDGSAWVDLGGSISITPVTVNTISASLDPVIVFNSVLSLTPITVNSNSIALEPTITFASSLDLLPNTINSNSLGLNPIIQFRGTLDLTPNTLDTLSATLNPSIDFASALTIAPQTLNSTSISISPLIEFKSIINLTPGTLNTASVPLNPVITTGQVQAVGVVTAGFADDKYSVKYKLSGITVNFKE